MAEQLTRFVDCGGFSRPLQATFWEAALMRSDLKGAEASLVAGSPLAAGRGVPCGAPEVAKCRPTVWVVSERAGLTVRPLSISRIESRP
jgi:hypothetical protein